MPSVNIEEGRRLLKRFRKLGKDDFASLDEKVTSAIEWGRWLRVNAPRMMNELAQRRTEGERPMTAEEFARELVKKIKATIAEHREYEDGRAAAQWCWMLLEVRDLAAAHGIKIEEGE